MDNEKSKTMTSEQMMEDYGILQREVSDLLVLSCRPDQSTLLFYSSRSEELNETAKMIHEKDEEIKELKMRLKKKTILGRIDHYIEKSSGYKIGFYSIILSFLLSIILIVLRNIQILQ